MQSVLLLLSIPCLLEFSAQALQKSFIRQRSASHHNFDLASLQAYKKGEYAPRPQPLAISITEFIPLESPQTSALTPLLHDDAHEIFKEHAQAVATLCRNQADTTDKLKTELSTLLSNYRILSEFEAAIDQLAEKTDQVKNSTLRTSEAIPSQPSPLLSRRTVAVSGLSVVTAGLTARYIHQKQLKFEPFTIIAGLGAVKSALGGAAILAGVWLVLDKIYGMIHEGCREREKNIKLRAAQNEEELERTYKAKAQELKEEFEKLKKKVNEASQYDREVLIKKFDEFKNSQELMIKEHKKQTEERIKEVLLRMGESENTVNGLKEVKEKIVESTKVIHDDLTHAVERLKKSLRIIEGVAKKLPDAEKKAAEAAILEAETSFNQALEQTQAIQANAAAIQSPQGFLGRLFHRRTPSRGGPNSRSSSMTFLPQQLEALKSLSNSASNTPPAPPNTAQPLTGTIGSSPNTPASAQIRRLTQPNEER